MEYFLKKNFMGVFHDAIMLLHGARIRKKKSLSFYITDDEAADFDATFTSSFQSELMFQLLL